MIPIRKAVFPVAGLGTRFLPATKAMAKEMLTVVDRPLIQHVVDEAREAGIEHFIFVTGRNKGVIEDHFDLQFELEQTLAARGKKAELSVLAEAQLAADQFARAPHRMAQAERRLLAPTGRPRALLGAAPRRADPRDAKLHRADGR